MIIVQGGEVDETEKRVNEPRSGLKKPSSRRFTVGDYGRSQIRSNAKR